MYAIRSYYENNLKSITMNEYRKPFSKEILHIENINEVIDKICNQLREDVFKRFRRYGA